MDANTYNYELSESEQMLLGLFYAIFKKQHIEYSVFKHMRSFLEEDKLNLQYYKNRNFQKEIKTKFVEQNLSLMEIFCDYYKEVRKYICLSFHHIDKFIVNEQLKVMLQDIDELGYDLKNMRRYADETDSYEDKQLVELIGDSMDKKEISYRNTEEFRFGNIGKPYRELIKKRKLEKLKREYIKNGFTLSELEVGNLF